MKRIRRKSVPAASAGPRPVAALPGALVESLLRGGTMTAPDAGMPMLKRAVDCTLAVAIAVVAAPILLIAAVLVRLSSRGPAIYTQERVGFGERRFTIFKLRTMIHDCESLTGPKWSVPGDPRVTPLGRWLRKLHIDELPQLLNVLRGDMSLVGPRPERPVFVAKLARKIPHYPARHAVPPGITGLAQVYLPPDIEVADVERKLGFDLYYARHASLWLDLRILLCTALKVLGLRGWIRAIVPVRADAVDGPVTLAFPTDRPASRAA
jgi:lipopolysaccharide/colanic/teichoic acid biosynthesis glycosyltransferase